MGRIVSQVFRRRDAATVTAMYRAGVRHAERVLPEGGGNPRGGRAGRPGIPRFPAVAQEALAHHQRPGADNREIKCRSRVVQAFPSTASLMRLAGSVMSEQDEAWQESRCLFGGKDERALRRGSHVRDRRDGRLGAAGSGAGKIIESGLELTDRIEAA